VEWEIVMKTRDERQIVRLKVANKANVPSESLAREIMDALDAADALEDERDAIVNQRDGSYAIGKQYESLIETLSARCAELETMVREAKGCPCLLAEPCSNQCTCAHPGMSGGCARCARYGSSQQRLAASEWLASQSSNLAQAKALLEEANKENKYEDNVLLSADWFDRVRAFLNQTESLGGEK
jgi:hypothetical protein